MFFCSFCSVFDEFDCIFIVDILDLKNKKLFNCFMERPKFVIYWMQMEKSQAKTFFISSFLNAGPYCMRYLQTVFVLYSPEVRLSFLIKMGVSGAGEMKGASSVSFGNLRQCKVQHFFCSQNICCVFLYKTISLCTTKLNYLKSYEKKLKMIFDFLFYFSEDFVGKLNVVDSCRIFFENRV